MSKGKVKKLPISKDDYGTPFSLFNYFDKRYGFSMDVAASGINNKCSIYSENSLDVEWLDINWCNPPFSLKKEFIEKAIVEGEKGKIILMLLPASVGSKWFNRARLFASKIYFIVGRIKFVGCDNFADFDVCLFEFSNKKNNDKYVWLSLKAEDRK